VPAFGNHTPLTLASIKIAIGVVLWAAQLVGLLGLYLSDRLANDSAREIEKDWPCFTGKSIPVRFEV
jgi:hypothetical protein